MTMTNQTMAPAVPANEVKKPILTAAQLKEVATQLGPLIEDPLIGVKAEFEDEIDLETKSAAKVLESQNREQAAISGRSIASLTEDDAYNLEVGIAASAMHSANFLKVVLKDKNYIARWGNTNSIRQGQLVAQGFKYITSDDVENLDTLEMHLDAMDHFTWADLVAVKIPKNIYYAGLRKAYLKSLHATNNKKAAEAGAAFAKTNLTGTLSGAERSYVATHLDQNKPIYNPPLGV